MSEIIGAYKPYILSSRNAAGELLPALYKEQGSVGQVALGSIELGRIDAILNFLDSENINGLLERQELTLGMIKPQANEGHNLPQDDDDAANFLLDEIDRDRIIFSAAFQFTPAQVETFYAPNKVRQSAMVDERTGRIVWNWNTEYMSSGPITVFLLQEQGAVQWWRNKMGNTDPSLADPESLRGKYARGLPDNLVHGSDSEASVQRELIAFQQALIETVGRSTLNGQEFPRVQDYIESGLVLSTQRILYQTRLSERIREGNAWTTNFRLAVMGDNEEVTTRDVKHNYGLNPI